MSSINWRRLLFGPINRAGLAVIIALALIANIIVAGFSFWLGARLSLPSDFLARQDATHEKLEQYLQANAAHPEKIKELIYSYEKTSRSSELMQVNLARALTSAGVTNVLISLLLAMCIVAILQKRSAPL